MFWRNLTPELVKEAQGLGLKVLPWTVNEPADMTRLVEWRVDGIITDYPDRLRKVMAEKGTAAAARRRRVESRVSAASVGSEKFPVWRVGSESTFVFWRRFATRAESQLPTRQTGKFSVSDPT